MGIPCHSYLLCSHVEYYANLHLHSFNIHDDTLAHYDIDGCADKVVYGPWPGTPTTNTVGCRLTIL